MSTVHDARWEVLLHTVVELSTLSRGDLGDLSVSRRVLVAVERVFPGMDGRLVVLEGGELLGFTLPRPLGSESAMPVGAVAASPIVLQWLRQVAAEGHADGLPAVVGHGLQLPARHLRVAALVGAHGPQGFLALQGQHWDSEDQRCLALLAAQSGTVLENARLYRRLEHEAETDGLTGAYNYRYFMRALEAEMARVDRHGGTCALLMVDVDNLKEYNGQFGHLGGSAALKELARLLEGGTRSIDVVAKYGGDEFSLLLPECGWEGALRLAERMLERVRGHAFEGDPARRLTISVGISVHPDEGMTPRELLRRADDRLYRAKDSGRNRIGTR